MSELITPSQCRAARALLDISQGDLADETGISKPAISAFESGNAESKPATVRNIRHALERGGVEFGADEGVKRRSQTMLVWEGKDANRRLLDDIYTTLKTTGGEILIAGLKEVSRERKDDYDFLQWHLGRLQDAGITERILISEGDTNLAAPAHWYRQIPEEYFSQATYQLYGDKLAMIAWGDEQRIILIENRLFARAFSKFFDFAWDHAKPVDGA